MIRLTCQLFLALFLTSAFALIPEVTPAQKEQTEVQTEDIVYTKDERVIRGKIQSIDSETGTVIIVDHQGSKYILQADNILKIQEDQVVQVRKKWFGRDTVYTHQDSGFDIQVGFFVGSNAVSRSFTPDEYWLESSQVFNDMPLGGRVGLGLQVDSVHYIGAVVDLAFASWNASNFSGGLRYVNRFPTKRNAAFYVPVELRYSAISGELQFKVYEDDPNFWLDEAWEYYDFEQSGLELTLGTGVQWALANQRAVSIEVSLFRQFNMQVEFDGIPAGQTQPDVEYSMSGGRFALMYHL